MDKLKLQGIVFFLFLLFSYCKHAVKKNLKHSFGIDYSGDQSLICTVCTRTLYLVNDVYLKISASQDENDCINLFLFFYCYYFGGGGSMCIYQRYCADFSFAF